MKMKNKLPLALALALVAPLAAHAYDALNVANNIASPIGNSTSSYTFGELFVYIADKFILLLKATAVLIIARAALLFIVEQSEGELEKFKKTNRIDDLNAFRNNNVKFFNHALR